MFVVVLEDGTHLLEGQNVQSWDDVPTDKRIAQVGLTDGGHNLIDEISGYDYYVVLYEGVKAMHAVANLEGGFDITGDSPAKTVKQYVYGIADYNKKTIQKAKGYIIAEIEAAFNDAVQAKNRIQIKARAQMIDLVEKKVEKIISDLNAKEVVCLELSLSKRYLKRSELKVPNTAIRDGKSVPTDLDDIKKVKESISSVFQILKKNPFDKKEKKE